jgi:predicted RNA-binding Zn-ribbon protein involved in translation (DUF1610 family)
VSGATYRCVPCGTRLTPSRRNPASWLAWLVRATWHHRRCGAARAARDRRVTRLYCPGCGNHLVATVRLRSGRLTLRRSWNDEHRRCHEAAAVAARQRRQETAEDELQRWVASALADVQAAEDDQRDRDDEGNRP